MNRRTENAAHRRIAIVNAALDEFIDKGFAAARMEDIARRAGVAKGTIYLNFTDKEALFEAIVQQELRPRLDAAAALAASSGSLHDFLDRTLIPMLVDVAGSRRGAVMRLLIGEAGRFPNLAAVYFRLVIEPGLALMSSLSKRAFERGEIADDAVLRFPQLMVAPMIITVLWRGLFERFRPLDAEKMARAYFDHLLARPAKSSRRKSR